MAQIDNIVRRKRLRFPIGKIVSYIVFIAWFLITVLPLIWMGYSSFKSNEELNLDVFALPHDLFDNYNDEYIVVKDQLNIPYDFDRRVDKRPRLILESATIGWSKRMLVYFPLKSELSPSVANRKPGESVYVRELPPHIQAQIGWLTIWYNYIQAFNRGGMATKFLNSVIYSTCGAGLIVMLGLMMGFGLSKLKFPKLSKFISALVGLGYLLAINSVIIPLYLMISSIGLNDTHIGVILVYTAFGLPVSVLLSTQFIRGLPDSLVESAFIDGASTMRTFFQIILPMSIPVAATVGILQFLGIWNEFILVLIVASSEATKSLPVGVYSFAGLTSSQLGWQLAAMIMALLPAMIFYFIFNKRIAQGVVGGAIKG